MSDDRDSTAPRLTPWQTLVSVFRAFAGVQTSANRERDFEHGKPSHFIVAGILLTAVFVGVVASVVWFALG